MILVLAGREEESVVLEGISGLTSKFSVRRIKEKRQSQYKSIYIILFMMLLRAGICFVFLIFLFLLFFFSVLFFFILFSSALLLGVFFCFFFPGKMVEGVLRVYDAKYSIVRDWGNGNKYTRCQGACSVRRETDGGRGVKREDW